jgi:uncharacterized damage-inducible protein DinB
MESAFAHHVWATRRVIDACEQLSAEQLTAPVPGTYGSIIASLRHLVGADAWYLHSLTDGRHPDTETANLDLADLSATMENHHAAWQAVARDEGDAMRVVYTWNDGAFDFGAQVGIRLTQALLHGADHRSQICTGLTLAGVEPPLIDAWDFAEALGISISTQPEGLEPPAK